MNVYLWLVKLGSSLGRFSGDVIIRDFELSGLVATLEMDCL